MRTILLASIIFTLLCAGQPRKRESIPVVQINVLVRDSNGQPATVTAADFAISEGEDKLRVELFSVDTTNTVLAGDSPKLPPGVFMNTLMRRSGTLTSITAVLIDGWSTGPAERSAVMAESRKLIGKLLGSAGVAIYTLGGTLDVVQDFSAGPRITASDEALKNAFTPISDYVLTDRVKRSADVLEEVANHLAVLPGRKNVVWVAGKPALPSDSERVEATFSRAGAALYLVQFDTGRFSESAERVALRSGGQAFPSVTVLEPIVRHVISDISRSYTLGFRPERTDAKFHELTVNVPNKPGLRVQHPLGYYAIHPSTSSVQALADRVQQSMSTSLDSTTLNVMGNLKRTKVKHEEWLEADVVLMPRQIMTPHERLLDMYTGAIDVVIEQSDLGGLMLSTIADNGYLEMTGEMFQKMSTGAKVHKSVRLEPEADQVRIFVQNRRNGTVGSLFVPKSAIPTTSE